MHIIVTFLSDNAVNVYDIKHEFDIQFSQKIMAYMEKKHDLFA